MRRSTSVVLPLVLVLVGCQDYTFSDNIEQWDDSLVRPPPSLTQTDRIVQLRTPKVDILWTIDNSGSMANEQAALTASFESFMNYFLGSGLDYHIGVTSTDIIRSDYSGSSGTLVVHDGQSYIDVDTSDPVTVFYNIANLGTSGMSPERGLGASYLALEEKRDTANAGFYRDDAAIHNIVITDESDWTQPTTITTDEFIDWFDGLKTDSDQRGFHCICDFADRSDYETVSRAIGGVLVDGQKTDDWTLILDELGLQTSGFKREYFLSRLPVEESLVVEVETADGFVQDFQRADIDAATGLPLDGDGDGAADGDYTYDAGRNSITFLTYIPDELSTVIITYDVLGAEGGQDQL